MTFSGGSGAPLASGQAYDLRFLPDRLMISRPGSVTATVEVPYRDTETVEVGGPGQVSMSTGEVLALTLGLGLLGALLGLFILGVLGFLLGALILGLVGAAIAAASTKIQTVVRIRSGDAEFNFLDIVKRPEVLRIDLSEAFAAIARARAAQAGDPDDRAESASESISDQISNLSSLLREGLITRDEFERIKARVISKE